ncbi:hypothetical protein BM86_11800 [Bacillus thuringiensis]|uniref:DNA-binding protein n=1 Tax=Bacillus thuringiensis TaxID=1428 RepID=A0A9W3SAZ9_BACTU|nr:hypothetical protein [Bacillus thuringiensis]ANS47591.1 hypothetical protein BT246_22170 [Bacillus thuringiensis]MBH0336156.1 hypothetical protein [Bacillus thuringiensis]
MTILSESAEREVINLITSKIDEAIERNEQMRPMQDLVNQSVLMKELGIKYGFLRKMERHGLQRIQLEENDRTVFYSRKQLNEFMAKYAQ